MCTVRTEFVDCKSLRFSVFSKTNKKIPNAVESSKSYHCLQVQLYCKLISEKLQEKLVPENPFLPTVCEAVFKGCPLLGRKLWAISLMVLQKCKLAVEKYLPKPLAATGASSSSVVPCLEGQGCSGGSSAGVIPSGDLVGVPPILHAAGTFYGPPLG